jgi:hypothetical protein
MSLFRATLHCTLLGQQMANVLHFEKPDATADQMVILASKINAWVISNPMSLHASSDVRWFNIHIEDVDGTFDAIDFPTDISGTDIPWNNGSPVMNAVIQLRTQNKTRRGRGRFFMPGWGAKGMTNGFWSAPVLLEGNAVAQALEDFWVNTTNPNYKNTGFNWMVASRKQDETGTRFLVESIKFRALPGTVRRRQIGVGT